MDPTFELPPPHELLATGHTPAQINTASVNQTKKGITMCGSCQGWIYNSRTDQMVCGTCGEEWPDGSYMRCRVDKAAEERDARAEEGAEEEEAARRRTGEGALAGKRRR